MIEAAIEIGALQQRADDHESRLRRIEEALSSQRGATKVILIAVGIVGPVITAFLVKVLHF